MFYLPSLSVKNVFMIIFIFSIFPIFLFPILPFTIFFVNFCGYSVNSRQDFCDFIFNVLNILSLSAQRGTVVLFLVGSWFLLAISLRCTIVNKDNNNKRLVQQLTARNSLRFLVLYRTFYYEQIIDNVLRTRGFILFNTNINKMNNLISNELSVS